MISTSWGSHLILTQEVLDNLEEGVVYGIHGEKLGDNPHCDPFAGQWKGQCQDRVIFLVFLFESMLKVVHAMLVMLGSCSEDSDVSAIYLEIVAVAACILASTIVFYADFVGAEAGKAVVCFFMFFVLRVAPCCVFLLVLLLLVLFVVRCSCLFQLFVSSCVVVVIIC